MNILVIDLKNETNKYIYNGTVDDCKAICNVIPRCHGFSRTRTGNTCHFKKELNSFITNPNTMTNHDSYDIGKNITHRTKTT